MIEKLKKEYAIFQLSEDFLKDYFNKYKSNNVRNYLNRYIKAQWYNQEIDWFIDLINKTIVDGISREVNLNTIECLVNLLSSYKLIITKSILEILLENCPVLNDILDSIIVKENYSLTDIESITTNANVQDFLITYCLINNCYKGKYIPLNISKDNYSNNIYKSINKNILNEEEKLKLIKEVKFNPEALNKLVLNYVPYVRYIVYKRYYKSNIDSDDLIQVGVLAIYEALLHYQEERGSLDDFCMSYIKYKINRFIKKEYHYQENVSLGNVSLKGSYVYEDNSLKEILNFIDYLNPRESFILKSYYGIETECSKTALGNMLNISKERVRQIIDSSIIKLKKIAIIKGYDFPIYGEYEKYAFSTYKDIINYHQYYYNYHGPREFEEKIWQQLILKMQFSNKEILKEIKMALNYGFITLKTALFLGTLEDKEAIEYLIKIVTKQLELGDIGLAKKRKKC